MQEKQEEIKEIKRTLNDLTAKFKDKFDELSKVEEKQEYDEGKINENATHITSLENTRANGHGTTQAGLLLRRMDALEKNAGATTSPDPNVAALEPQLESLETRIAALENKKESDE